MRTWTALILLSCAQFIMVLDSSVMNVSITQIVHDLNTSVEGVQLAITAYTLVMAAFMLVGAKLGDIWGRNRAFAIGLGVYGAGSLLTSLSPSLPWLLFGWSLVEGLGACLVIPAIAALVIANYEGKQRALAYGVLGGIAGAAIAVGPLIGGWVTTEFSWRYVFAAETICVIIILLFRGRIATAARSERIPKLDIVGAALSALGLGIVVLAVLRSSTWGWIMPIDPPTIAGVEIAPFGFSPLPFVVLIGVLVLVCFARWEEHREHGGHDTLLNRSLLRITALRGGLVTLTFQQLILLGTFFVLPVYLQVVLGLNAFETGKKLLPLSLLLVVAALAGPRMAARRSPRRVAQVGFVALALGALMLAGSVDTELNDTTFRIALAVLGIGAGLLLSQLGNVIMSSAPPQDTNEAGGLQGTFQNLGASLGTALVGSVLLAGLTSGFVGNIQKNEHLSPEVRAQVADAADQGIDILPVDDVERIVSNAGATDAQAAAIADDYADAQIGALKMSLFVVAVIAAGGFWPARNLPNVSLEATKPT